MTLRLPQRLVLVSLVAAVNYFGVSLIVVADDTEIFFNSPASTTSSGRPKVMIIVDDSGSMDTVIESRPPYDPARNDYNGGIGAGEANRIYWSTTGAPPAADSDQWFDASVNRCGSSFEPLATRGFFTSGGALRWRPESEVEVCEPLCPDGWTLDSEQGAAICVQEGSSPIPPTQQCQAVTLPGGWELVAAGNNNPPHVECEVDLQNEEPDNGADVAPGFPLDGVSDDQAFGAETAADSNVSFATEDTYTFFSSNYVDYYNDGSILVSTTRLAVAQDVIANLIATSPSVDFGLTTFNRNDLDGGHDGGRVVHRIIESMSDTERAALVDMVENELSADGWTPLCESYSEVYRYLTGASVNYGVLRDASGDPPVDLPVEDVLAFDPENSDQYEAPTQDCGPIHVILMTDGQPSYDTDANSFIKSLPGITLRNGESCDEWEDGNGGTSENCLPELAGYMATHDVAGEPVSAEADNYPLALTYTIGFDISQPLLEAAATAIRSDDLTPAYYEASDAAQLTSAFSEILATILEVESTFTSPAVAVDSFARTRSRDDVYFAMFTPGNRVDWPGNVKRLRLLIDGDEATLVTENGEPAINPLDGTIRDQVSTYWSNHDGGTVEEGGVGGRLLQVDPDSRDIYINTGSDNTLEDFVAANIDAEGFGEADMEGVYALFGVNSQEFLEQLIDYIRGDRVDDLGNREWVMGDPLHSQPLIIDYGALDGFTVDDPDVRILVGTNAGLLHMFGNVDGDEDWAFFPKELAPIINQRRTNELSNAHVYGVDLTPSIYTQDLNGDGTLDHAEGDKVWVYVGLRRGGRILYAMDVSNPDNPELLWQKSSEDTDFAELGQTWSQPVVTRIPGYFDADTGAPLPVVIMGAGYDPNKDSTAEGTDDSVGRGVFILDAETGALVRKITPAANSDTNLNAPGLVDSVPGGVAILDSNADFLTDRLYFADTGGNVWRVDINPGLPNFDSGESWRITRLAALAVDGTGASDRRFFNRPDIVRIRDDDGYAVDAILIGSGDRTNPLATDVNNFFYLLRDRQVLPYTTDAPTSAECSPAEPFAGVLDFRCSLPITTAQLYDIGNTLLRTGTDDQINAEQSLLSSAPGWRFPLTGTGEKSLSDSVTIAGFVSFTTYTPPGVRVDANACRPTLGRGALYILNIYDGDRDLIWLGPFPPDTPSVHVGSDGKVRFILPPGAPPVVADDPDGLMACQGGICDLFQVFPGPQANYWYRQEY